MTLRLVAGLPSLRERDLYIVVEDAIRANERKGLRVVEFTVQANHLHLIVEADDARAFSRGMQGLTIRMARAINRALSRKGKVFADRYHRHDLKTPTEVRNCLTYVFLNTEHHAKGYGLRHKQVDPFSSASWFTGWSKPIETIRKLGPSPAAPAETWLLRTGWKRLGLLDPIPKPRALGTS